VLIVLTTVADRKFGEIFAEQIVNAGLAACVQVLPQMTSVYVWEGQVQREGEHLVLIKTLPEKWEELRDFITANHPYEVPEIVAIESDKVGGPYLDWLTAVLEKKP
jgi:periplasmic divalent cation tolerance protein